MSEYLSNTVHGVTNGMLVVFIVDKFLPLFVVYIREPGKLLAPRRHFEASIHSHINKAVSGVLNRLNLIMTQIY